MLQNRLIDANPKEHSIDRAYVDEEKRCASPDIVAAEELDLIYNFAHIENDLNESNAPDQWYDPSDPYERQQMCVPKNQ